MFKGFSLPLRPNLQPWLHNAMGPERPQDDGSVSTDGPEGRSELKDAASVELIDLRDGTEEDGALTLRHPESKDDQDDRVPDSKVSSSTASSPAVRALPSTGIANVFTSNTQKSFRNAQASTTKAVGNISKTLAKVSADISTATQNLVSELPEKTPTFWKTLTTETQKALNDIQHGISDTINGIPVPKAFTQTRQDFEDLARLHMKRPGICSRCASLSLQSCFSDEADANAKSLYWQSSLARVALHASWCRHCNLLLAMFCRPEHDPLLVPEIRDNIKHEELKGLPLTEWVSGNYIYKDEYWPFGRSRLPTEGSLQNLDKLGRLVWLGARAGLSVANAYNSYQSASRQVKSGRPPPATQHYQEYRKGYVQGQNRGKQKATANTRYPISCVIVMTVSRKDAVHPGLLRVNLFGANSHDPERRLLSHFKLRAAKQDLPTNIRADHPISYGHVLDRNWIDTSIVQPWLIECEVKHDEKCSEHGWNVGMNKPEFLRLIDVERQCIVAFDKPQNVRYVALSYVWGDSEMVKLQEHNIDVFSEPGGLDSALNAIPRTIVDAMDIVRNLGERFLWTDALCILQEDSEDSRKQIASMDAVYGSALVTIVAAGGEHAHHGLDGVRRRYLPETEGTENPRCNSQRTAEISKGIYVIAPARERPDWQQSLWNKRAWTFQEQLLSRRLLIFSEHGMQWKCRCMTCHEDMAPAENADEATDSLWLELKPQYFGINHDPHWVDGSFVTNRHDQTHIVRSGTFATYTRVIESYCPRQLSKEEDSLNALAGLLRLFAKCFKSECLYGLPTALFDIALLWRPKGPDAVPRPGNDSFPSWSWASWKGSIGYNHPVQIAQDESGQKLEVEGIRPLLRYYQFNAFMGNLQPLNGEGLGLQLINRELPKEWDTHPLNKARPVRLVEKASDLFEDLDPRLIPHLSDQHLIFWTSAANVWTLDEPNSAESRAPRRLLRTKLTSYTPLGKTGTVQLDGPDFGQLVGERHEFILMAEAHSTLVDGQTAMGEYSHYLVMLIETDASTCVSKRLGLGYISKNEWLVANPTSRLICLG